MAAERHRKWFHTTDGSFDFVRLVEQLIPTAVIGGLVLFATVRVIQTQVSDMRLEVKELKREIASQSKELTTLGAQMPMFLNQQTQLNTATDARLTYIEHGLFTGAGRR